MRTHRYGLLGILMAGLLVRLVAAALAPHPGIADSNHYFLLGQNLAAGRGFVIDYVWQFHNPPDAVTHPIDYWMPLPGVWAALGLRLFGGTLLAALIPSAVFGALLPLLAYFLAGAADLDDDGRLFAAALTVFLPELVLNSARTDTAITFVLFGALGALLFYRGMTARPPLLLLAGMCFGAAHLTRNDGILFAPAVIVTVGVWWLVKRESVRWAWLLLVPAGWLLVAAPWLWRNYTLYGEFISSGARRLTYMTFFEDQFTYGRTLDLEHYLAWGWRNILGNMAFQALANVKTLYTVPGVALTALALGGLLAWLRRWQREKVLLLALPVVFVAGLYVYYTVVAPFGTMGGSFKKSYMVLLPFIAVVAAWTLTEFVSARRAAWVGVGLLVGLTLLQAVDLVRLDFNAARTYSDSVAEMGEVLRDLGDVNGDGEIVVMTQDPFMLNYHGFPAVTIPSDDRDTILEAAHRYGVDYINLPANRPALNPLYNGDETDPRLPLVGESDFYQLLEVVPLG